MRVLNFGSLNIDYVYRVAHFVRPGETLAADAFARFPGGKGLNQSLALARAGAEVLHAGAVGPDGAFLRELLESEGVDCRFLRTLPETPTGHAMIQVAASGENSIVLFGGANRAIPAELIDAATAALEPGDFLLLQNEISGMETILRRAAERKLRVFFNPAPMRADAAALPLDAVDTLILNETEAEEFSRLAPEALKTTNLLLTYGARGAEFRPVAGPPVRVPACRVEHVADTTAAGDTFIGYFLAALLAGEAPEPALKRASRASAWCVARAGAAPSIPRRDQLQPSGTGTAGIRPE